MFAVRLTSLVILVGLGYAVVPEASGKQDPKDEKDPVDRKPTGYFDVKRYKTEGIPDAKLKEAKAKFAMFAKYNSEAIAWPRRYALLQDMTATLQPTQTIDGILNELEGHIFVPVPGNRVGKEQSTYIREMGKALDDELKELILKHPDRIVRINAARMLSVACKSGAWAHYPTVTALISQSEIRVNDVALPVIPEVRYYALQAAGNLLAAHELAAFQPDGYDNRNHSGEPEAVGALIQALETAVLDPGKMIGMPPAKADIPAEQKAVLIFFRRQAIKSLGQVRFAAFTIVNKGTLHPSITLARVAVSDKTLVVPPRADEVAEAVIGIGNMDPPARASERNLYAGGIGEVVATGVLTYGGDSVVNPPDKAIAWKGGAARMLDSLNRWRARFQPALLPKLLNDPNFDPERNSAFNAQNIPPTIQAVYAQSKLRILDPIAFKSGKIDVEEMRKFVAQDMRKATAMDPTITLFENPKLTVPRKAL